MKKHLNKILLLISSFFAMLANAITNVKNLVNKDSAKKQTFNSVNTNKQAMKLTFEHLEKYPFYTETHTVGLIVLYNKDVFLPVSLDNIDYILQKQLKPILRPLSEIDSDFIQGLRLPSAQERELHYLCKIQDFSNATPESAKILADNFFDIYDLIGMGLAVNYNFESQESIKSNAIKALSYKFKF